jgi:hypothetical protein
MHSLGVRGWQGAPAPNGRVARRIRCEGCMFDARLQGESVGGCADAWRRAATPTEPASPPRTSRARAAECFTFDVGSPTESRRLRTLTQSFQVRRRAAVWRRRRPPLPAPPRGHARHGRRGTWHRWGASNKTGMPPRACRSLERLGTGGVRRPLAPSAADRAPPLLPPLPQAQTACPTRPLAPLG